MENFGRTPNPQILIAFRLSLSKWLPIFREQAQPGSSHSQSFIPKNYWRLESNARPGLKPHNPAQRAMLDQGSSHKILPREQRSTRTHIQESCLESNAQPGLTQHTYQHSINTIVQQSWWYPPGSMFYRFSKSYIFYT